MAEPAKKPTEDKAKLHELSVYVWQKVTEVVCDRLGIDTGRHDYGPVSDYLGIDRADGNAYKLGRKAIGNQRRVEILMRLGVSQEALLTYTPKNRRLKLATGGRPDVKYGEDSDLDGNTGNGQQEKGALRDNDQLLIDLLREKTSALEGQLSQSMDTITKQQEEIDRLKKLLARSVDKSSIPDG